MNSKQHYNRCYLPKIEVKKDKKEDLDPHIANKNRVISEIKDLINIWKNRSNKQLEKSEIQGKKEKTKLPEFPELQKLSVDLKVDKHPENPPK